jgi:hypothetical protein
LQNIISIQYEAGSFEKCAAFVWVTNGGKWKMTIWEQREICWFNSFGTLKRAMLTPSAVNASQSKINNVSVGFILL